MLTARTSHNQRSPFTATQWQELEHQALIFKYMVSGVPIPPDLIFSVKRSLDSASFSSRLFSHHPGGWGCFEMGFGRKVDPEPGRCRRTDGKKWRCSKEAYPDSKYCERHMHRGRNRSRKHVEVSSSSSSSQTSSLTAAGSVSVAAATIAPAQPVPAPISSSSSYVLSESNQSLYNSSFMYPDSSSSSPYFCLKSEPYFQGSKESVDELAFFPEQARGFADPLMAYNRSYSQQPQYQALTESSKEPLKQSGEDQHCFVLGTDFKSERPSKETQKPLHHFFGEWPPKNNSSVADSWLDLASNSRVPNDG